MKVLHVMPSFYPATYYGGAIASGLGLCHSLAQQGVEVRVLTTNANGPGTVLNVKTEKMVERAEGFQVQYCQRVCRDSVSLTLLRLLPSSIRWSDVVHLTAVYSFPTIPTLIYCRLIGRPVVWSPRGSLQRWAGSTRPRLKTVWDDLCQLVAPKRVVLHVTSVEEERESLERFPRFKAVVIPNGIDMPADLHPVLGNGTFRLLFLGRLHPKKGIENLLESCALLDRGQSINWSLTIAGAGEAGYTESLRARIRTLELSPKVAMVGEIVGTAKQHLFEHADLLVAPSFTENFGLVVAESLAHGVPVIAARGAPWKRLEEVGCGLWVENDPESLAKAIEHVSGMPLGEMGRRGRQWMKNEFAWDPIALRMKKLYQQLAECSP